jgi:exopolyphosphatase/guanosine-5'-triphosphate,3'-diphosphate pyrophosphatase
MDSVRRAVIDVGTNSIKLLVADVVGHVAQPVREESQQTRLGSGFYESRRLQPRAIAATAQAVADFAETARQVQAGSIRVIATSAARDALNHAELTEAIERACGLKVEIVSGEQEADWVFQGVTTNPELADQPVLVMDVGGGSAEFILGRGARQHFRQSFPLGTVRLLEKLAPGDPPKAQELAACRLWLREFLEKEVRPTLQPAMSQEEGAAVVLPRPPTLDPRLSTKLSLVGTGGTTSIMGCIEAELDVFDRQRIEATQLSLERVRWQNERLWGLPLAARKTIVGLPPNRADVILMGVAIYEAVMEVLEFTELRISTRGLRFGAMLDGR